MLLAGVFDSVADHHGNELDTEFQSAMRGSIDVCQLPVVVERRAKKIFNQMTAI